MMPGAEFRPAIVVPVYNHGMQIGATVERLLAYDVPCILVDDGSNNDCAGILDAIASACPDTVTLLRHSVNAGKGAAVMTGMRDAAHKGYSHVLQIDADGQHDTSAVPGFLEESRQHPDAVICGYPRYDASVPKGRLYGRYATHVWVWINTLSLDIRDSMCGFRVYPLPPAIGVIERNHVGAHMDFDTEILVRLYWRGVPVRNREIQVIYPANGVSHFDLWRDNIRISRMHARLFFGMLKRLPNRLSGHRADR